MFIITERPYEYILCNEVLVPVIFRCTGHIARI